MFSVLSRRAVGPAVAVAVAFAAAGVSGDPAVAAVAPVASSHFLPHDVVTALTADQPPKAVVNGGPGAISPIVLSDDSAGGPLAFTLAGNAAFDVTHPVTVSVTAGDATVAASADGSFAATATVTPTASTVTVYVTPGSGPSTYQLSDVSVTGTAPGLVTVSVSDGTATFGPVTATAVVDAGRLAGADRYGTAAAAFTDAFSCAATGGQGTNGDGTGAAMIARGDAFADALASDYGAGQMWSGTLLTKPTTVPQATLDALKSAGVTAVVIVGGPSAISDAVSNKLAATEAYSCSGDAHQKINVLRVYGDDRYETAAILAELASSDANGNPTNVGTAAVNGTATTSTPLNTAVLATGTDFPDALAAGPMAYWGDNLPSAGNGVPFPLLLTSSTSLHWAAKVALSDLKIKQVLVVGGPAAVSTTVTNQLHALGISVIRLYGATRTDTAVKVAQFETAGVDGSGNNGLGYDGDGVALARADTFPDALAGGPWAGVHVSPLLLAPRPTALGPAAQSYLAALTADKAGAVVALGGETAITPDTLQSAADALTGTPGAAVTPNLRTAHAAVGFVPVRPARVSTWWRSADPAGRR